MRLICLLPIVLIVSGCIPNSLDKAKQNQVCEERGGVYGYVSEIYKVTCRDGSLHEWDEVILKPKHYPKGGE